MREFRMNKCIHFILVSFVLTAAFSSLYADSGAFTSYQLLKEIDLPDYDEWRLSFNVETTTWENFDYDEAISPEQISWHESIYTLSLEWGFWTFSRGDLNIGLELPFYFWYAKEDLKTQNNDNLTWPEGKIKNNGPMDLKAFADFKLKLTDNIYGILHGGVSIPGVSPMLYDLFSGLDADDIDTDYGVLRFEVGVGALFKYSRFIGRAQVGAELGGVPSTNPDFHIPAEYVPHATSEWTNSTILMLNLSSIFVATSSFGVGIDIDYRGQVFSDGDWDAANFNTVGGNNVPEAVTLLSLKFYFSASGGGGFYSVDSGSIFSFGIGKKLADSDLQPAVRYTLNYSQYF